VVAIRIVADEDDIDIWTMQKWVHGIVLISLSAIDKVKFTIRARDSRDAIMLIPRTWDACILREMIVIVAEQGLEEVEDLGGEHLFA